MENSKITWDSEKAGTFTDARDGQTYKVVRIGNQVWLAENLNFTKGLPKVSDIEEWRELGRNNQAAAWCYYENREENGEQFGALYTYEAALQVAPEGWHLPTTRDFKDLRIYVGNVLDALKKGGHTGFDTLLGGLRGVSGDFHAIGEVTGFWSASAKGRYIADAFNVGLYPLDKNIWVNVATIYPAEKTSGCYVRLILD